MIKIFENIDCMEGMNKYADLLKSRKTLAIVDPPYGIRDRMQGGDPLGQMSKNIVWNETVPGCDYFNLLLQCSDDQIIWGGNYYSSKLPDERCWLVWDKMQSKEINYAMHELAWTSFDTQPLILRFRTVSKGRIHPCQKPVALYRWLLQNYGKDYDLILDTHVGSASILIACEIEGFEYIGFELDTDYYRDAKARLERETAQVDLFKPEETKSDRIQRELF